MEKHLLSKSTFIRGVQCLKSLYLNKKRPFLRDRLPQERMIVFRRGHEVGGLAQQLFPGGIDMSPGHPSGYRRSVMLTQEKIRSGYPVIYEAGFQYDQVLIFLDILVKTATGWHAYEVKSSGGISPTYLMDAALQYYVIRGTGLDLQSISIIHIDRNYIRGDEIEPAKLFKTVHVTDEALSRQEFIRSQILKEKETLTLPHSPKIEVGPHCSDPYECDFIGHCWKHVPKEQKKELLQHFNPELLAAAKSRSEGNIAFLKVLPIQPAIPRYKGTHPYQPIAYAFALQTVNKTMISIYDHLGNPQAELQKQLLQATHDTDTVVCFAQEKIVSSLLPGKNTIDLAGFLADDSDLLFLKDGESLLENIQKLSGAGNSIPLYTSDPVCAHHYLKAYPSEDVKKTLEEYSGAWAATLAELYKQITAR